MNPPLVDMVLGFKGDWIRFNGYTWLIWTDANAEQITVSVKQLLKPQDSILVTAVDLNDYYGWAPPWVWSWIAGKKTQRPLIGR